MVADLDTTEYRDSEPEQYSSLDLDSTIQASPLSMGADDEFQETGDVSSLEEDFEEAEPSPSPEEDSPASLDALEIESGSEDSPARMETLEAEPEEEGFPEPSREVFGEDRSHLDLGPEPPALEIESIEPEAEPESAPFEVADAPATESQENEAAVIDLGGLQGGRQEIDLPISLEVGGKRIDFKLKVSLDLDAMECKGSARVTSEEGTPS